MIIIEGNFIDDGTAIIIGLSLACAKPTKEDPLLILRKRNEQRLNPLFPLFHGAIGIVIHLVL